MYAIQPSGAHRFQVGSRDTDFDPPDALGISWRRVIFQSARHLDKSQSLDLSAYRAAKLLIEERGANAPAQVVARAEAMLAKGDVGGLATWRSILRATRELLRTVPRGSVH